MHDDRLIVEDRVTRFLGQRLAAAVYQDRAPVSLTAWTVPGEPVPFAEAVRQQFSPVEIGARWGKPWGTMWIHATGALPAAWFGAAGELPSGTVAELIVDPGFTGGPGFNAEALAYRPDGTIIKGISPLNGWLPLDPGQPLDVYIEAAANPDVAGGFAFRPTALGDLATAGDGPLYRLERIELALRNIAVWELQQDVIALDGLMRALPLDMPRRWDILRALERMLDAVDPGDIAGTAAAGRAQLAGALARPAHATAHRVTAVGHAHIDSAWLWPVRETIRKCARTFANVVDLMDRYPDFHFACSSAQQFAWIKQGYPALYERIKQQVAAGRFVPVGSMWVEADTNMPGGEAMARQFIAGKRFFQEEFGIDTQEAWLPDSFGYSAALPQIVAAAGAKYFLTQKISWNQTNKMPHHTFLWEGIDGTQVFTHFPPVDTYHSDLGGAELAHAQRNYRDSGYGSMSLVPFGWGDGGGGPTREVLAAGERARSLEGSPTVTFGTPQQFFDQARAEYPAPPVWSGELYLEIHRGTYTTQARTKRGNRRSEHLLREAELWAATAAVRTGFPYPYADLEQCWQLVLLQQFHDILPGSSIAWVHQDAERNYAAIAARLEQIIAAVLQALAGQGTERLAFNATPFTRDGVAALGGGLASPAAAVTVEPAPAEADSAESGAAGFVLDNGQVRAVITAQGLLTSLVDAASGREAIAAGQAANLLQLHRDTPNKWDAWDIEEFYRHVVTDLDTADSVRLEGATVIVRRSFGDSVITQRLWLNGAALEIDHDIDWHESEKLLKLAFPLDVHADRSAAETQFGHVYRPTHSNTSWDFAKFEICAHRWVHVGEPGYGVAIANDSSYGHDIGRHSDGKVTTTTVRLSLLRAPKYPDPHADQGRHQLRVAIRPGAAIGDAVELGYHLNLPPREIDGSATETAPLLRVSAPAVVVEAVKLAEDRSGDVVVRMYESCGGRAHTSVWADFAHDRVTRTDLLERELATVPVESPGGAVVLNLRPFELVTLRYHRSAGG